MNSNDLDDQDDDNDDRPPSKSQRKRDMTALQKLGQQICELSDSQIKKIEMPEELLDAIFEVKRIKAHEGRRRQLQYVGKLMRRDGVDAAELQRGYDRVTGNSREEAMRLKIVTKLRDQLVDGSLAIEMALQRYPQLDEAELRSLMANVERDRNHSNLPITSRKLYRWLNDQIKV